MCEKMYLFYKTLSHVEQGFTMVLLIIIEVFYLLTYVSSVAPNYISEENQIYKFPNPCKYITYLKFVRCTQMTYYYNGPVNVNPSWQIHGILMYNI